MNPIKIIIYLVFSLFSFLSAQGKIELSGFVVNADDSTFLSDVNVNISAMKIGTATDEKGFFKMMLEPGVYSLQFSRIGYREFEKNITIDYKNNPVKVFLHPVVLNYSDEIVVYGDKDDDPLDKNKDKWLNSTDDIIQRFDGVAMMKRANFATEPTIRGSSAGQIGVVIDGMKMFHACVDRMDPVSAYVEVENLDRMELSRGAFDLTRNSVIGGTLNFITSMPKLNKPLEWETEAGYESVSALNRLRTSVNYASSDMAARLSFSAKKSSDYYAGKHSRIANSAFSKNNYTIDLLRQFGDNHKLRLSYIADNAWDIGYPALIMDATKTKSHIASITYSANALSKIFHSIKIKAYYTKVDHWMDDYNRTQKEIKNRVVMPNMYMPMYGKSSTIGLINEFIFFGNRQHVIKTIFDFYRLDAFADMKMYSLEPSIPEAYLVNIPDVRLYNYSATFDHLWNPRPDFRVRTNLRLDYSDRDIHDAFGKRQLQAFWDNPDSHKRYFAPALSISAAYDINAIHSVSLSAVRNERLPSHFENYGYLLYNVLDGYFYTGNPRLKTEKNQQVEFAYSTFTPSLKTQSRLYYTVINDYISGRIIEDEFKLYSNFKSVYMYGFENSLAYSFSSRLNIKSSLNYIFGQNSALDEPLPYITPLQVNLSLDYGYDFYWFELSAAHAASQNRIAAKSTLEDATPSFTVFNLRSRIEITQALELKTGIENILDKKYHEHLSISNLPARGRNIYLGLNFKYN